MLYKILYINSLKGAHYDATVIGEIYECEIARSVRKIFSLLEVLNVAMLAVRPLRRFPME